MPGTLIERTAEIDQIDRAIDAALAGSGWPLVFSGPAGIGKTALLDEARARAQAAGLVVLHARADQLEGGFPYGVVRQLVEATLTASPPARRAKLLADAAAPAAAVVVGPVGAPADPADQAFSIVHGLYWVIANLASEAPLALLLDDVHWADPPSLRFLTYLARRLEGLPATILATLRTGEAGPDEVLQTELQAGPGAQVSSPAPLSKAGVAMLLATEFGREPEEEFVRACVAVTGGNPFFLHELAGALRADGIEPTDEAAPTVSGAVPDTIARSTLLRLGRLSSDATELGRAVAVLGGEASLPRASVLAELSEDRALTALDVLVAADVLMPAEQLEFRHPIVRSAVYDELAPGARSALHRNAAAQLSAEGADIGVIAGHLLRTEPTGAEQTIATLREAAAHALAVGVPDGAGTYLERALAEGPERELRAGVLFELGTAQHLAGNPAAAVHLEEAVRLADSPLILAQAKLTLGWIAWYTASDPQAFRRYADGALAELADLDEPLRFRAEAIRAGVAMYDPILVDEFDNRRPILEEVVASGRPGTRPLALLLAAAAASRDEPRDRVMGFFERGWDGGRYLDEGDIPEILPQGLGALQALDELDRLSGVVDRLSDAARATGSVSAFLVSTIYRGAVAVSRGDLTSAAVEMRTLLDRAVELQLQLIVTTTPWILGEVLIERDDVADCAALVETLESGPSVDPSTAAGMIGTRGRLRFLEGRREEAIADLRHCGAVDQRTHFINAFSTAPWRSTLALMLDASEREEALVLVRDELDEARRSGRPRRIGIALRALGVIEPDGLSHLEEAVAVLADSPARLEHARALVELGAALRRGRNRAAAREPLRDGLDLAVRCGAARLAERARTELAATGARPRRERVTGRDALTPSELRVARMAAEGRTTRDIAQSLFVTTKTIDGHLAHIFTKLGISSRTQIAAAMAAQDEGVP